MPGTIHVRYDLCTGCRACQLACAIRNEGMVWPEAARIRVLQVGPGPLDIPVYCHRCSDHPCIAACPPKVRALSYHQDTGVVSVDPEQCLRSNSANCTRCFRACRAGAIAYHPRTGLPMHCNLCEGNPACVEACAAQALSYVPGSSFDGKHYARPVEDIVSDLCLRLYGRRDVG